MRWRARNSPRKWDSASSAGGGNRSLDCESYPSCENCASRSRGKRLAGVDANARDHRAQAVGALRREMFAKSQLVEQCDGIGGKNLLRRVAGIQRQQDRDQSAHDMGVAVAEVLQQRFAAGAAVELFREPGVAGATLHLVGGGMLGLRHRIECPV